MLVEHLGIEIAEFIEQNLILALDVVGISRHHEEQQRVTLDMAQKAETESLAFAGTLDDAGDVCHHKRLAVTITHDAK